VRIGWRTLEDVSVLSPREGKRPMKRRELLRGLGSVGIVGALSRHLFSINLTAQTPYTIHGSGPILLVFDRGVGQYDGLIERYRVIVMDYPPAILSYASFSIRSCSGARLECVSQSTAELAELAEIQGSSADSACSAVDSALCS
jgi:hypothetical protein